MRWLRAGPVRCPWLIRPPRRGTLAWWEGVPYIQVLRFRDGKHASFNLMYDRLLMLEHLGLVQA